MQSDNYPGTYNAITGSLTASGQTVYCKTSLCSNVTITMVASGLTGHTSIFEFSNDSTNGIDGNWYGFQAARTNANTVETGAASALTATPSYGWEASVNGYDWIRIRCTAQTGGTATYTIMRASYATEPIPALQSHAVSGTVTSNLGTVAPTLYADSTSNLGGNAAYTGTSRDAGSTPAYQYFCARAFADKAGTLSIQDSTDNSTWRTVSSIAVGANETKDLQARVLARYNKVYFLNGADAQGAFRLTSGYHRI